MTSPTMNPEIKRSFRLIPAAWIARTICLAERSSRLLVRLNVSPSALTVLGFLAGVTVGFFYAVERPGLAAAFLVVCGTFDILDGQVAKNANRKSLFGAILDSSLDRYAEFFIYAGLAYHFRHGWGLWLMFFAFLGSTMVSYTRARAEGLGVDCQMGIMQRAERLLLLFLGTVAGIIFRVIDPALVVVMTFIAVISNITAVQRIFYVKRCEKSRLSKEGDP